ncbi:glycosyltransferase [Mariprofundus erugo]|uniref:Glycosyltransferase n=1 Tax=Mariprofundus erugo TaxID=2528639 RepID=A0A5R9GYT2_9PROT|nr:glycosyltransferase [Mariprofundus erugo]TLS69037.1 glycosyltransferase [Mariprofundus erugo]
MDAQKPVSDELQGANWLYENAAEWHEQFRSEHGRPFRVLHIGNLANNAYLNSKMLRNMGVESDVLCCDYYHVMGCPEWEDADVIGDWSDDFAPKWHSVDLNGFSRPEWFVQGPIVECLEYLRLANSQSNPGVEKLREYLEYKSGLRVTYAVDAGPVEPQLPLAGSPREVPVGFLMRILKRLIRLVRADSHQTQSEPVQAEQIQPAHAPDLAAETMMRMMSRSEQLLSGRNTGLQETDLIGYCGILAQLAEVFAHYDLIHGYANAGIYPLLVDKQYVAYEHGTIRKTPFEETSQGRLCELVYKSANMVAITNCDAISAVKKLAISNFEFIPHPINEDWLVEDEKSIRLRAHIRSQANADFVVFHPSRQHWDEQRNPNMEKGNDFFINGFARFVREVNPSAACVMVEWGEMLEKSKKLIADLGISDRIIWVKTLPNREMVRYIMATDALADQFFLGAFGSTTPKALALGKPVFLYLNEDVHRWCFEEMPPVLNVQTSMEIFEGLQSLYRDQKLYNDISAGSRSWYQKYHSNHVITEKLCHIYQRAL